MKLKLSLVICAAMFFSVASAQNEVPPPKPPSELEPPPPPPPINDNTTPLIDVEPVIEEISPQPTEKIFVMFDVQKEPSFPGGTVAMYKFISDSLQYPVLAKEMAISGQVVLTFVVDTTGHLSDFNIVKDIGGGCGREVIRVLKSMPLWISGEANGHPVKVRYTLPVKFKSN